MTATTKLSKGEKELVRELYSRTKHTVDALPYTLEFDKLRSEFIGRSGKQLSDHDFWRALSNCRKAKTLVRKER